MRFSRVEVESRCDDVLSRAGEEHEELSAESLADAIAPFSIGNVAEILGRSTRSIYRFIREGKLRASVKVGIPPYDKFVGFTKCDIMKFVDES